MGIPYIFNTIHKYVTLLNKRPPLYTDLDLPPVLQTDDKGVFSTSLSEEYSIAANTFQLGKDALWDLSYNAIDYIFAGDGLKAKLREKWQRVKEEVLKS